MKLLCFLMGLINLLFVILAISVQAYGYMVVFYSLTVIFLFFSE